MIVFELFMSVYSVFSYIFILLTGISSYTCPSACSFTGFLRNAKFIAINSCLPELLYPFTVLFSSSSFVCTLNIFLTACTALPRVKILSNPHRIHSKEEDEEKEERGLPRAPVCCSTTSSSPSPSPPTHTARLLDCLGLRYQDTSPRPQ
jgi:hypothetical protein